MLASTALKVAGIIEFHYRKKRKDSIAINHEIAKALTGLQYEKFCRLIREGFSEQSNHAVRKYFGKEIFENPLDSEKSISDFQVSENYTLQRIFDAIAESVCD